MHYFRWFDLLALLWFCCGSHAWNELPFGRKEALLWSENRLTHLWCDVHYGGTVVPSIQSIGKQSCHTSSGEMRLRVKIVFIWFISDGPPYCAGCSVSINQFSFTHNVVAGFLFKDLSIIMQYSSVKGYGMRTFRSRTIRLRTVRPMDGSSHGLFVQPSHTNVI